VGKAFFHQLDFVEILREAVMTASFSRTRSKPSSDETLSSLLPAQVNHGSELLFFGQAGLRGSVKSERISDAAVEVRGGQLGRMAGNCPGVKTIEPAGIQLVPTTSADNLVIADAILSRFGKGPVGDLVHAERARSWTINFERVP
jgi:hypothetical protein